MTAARKSGAFVTLILRGDSASKRKFPIAHAESLLRLQIENQRDNWQLPKNSKFELSKDGKLIKRANKRTVQKSEEQNANSASDSTT